VHLVDFAIRVEVHLLGSNVKVQAVRSPWMPFTPRRKPEFSQQSFDVESQKYQHDKPI